ncbi:MAG: hypothetical protein EXR07_03780 [Acetobacteraceae bacterium]|nr:hypothetical protein [Acetobacteraceae bacterium]
MDRTHYVVRAGIARPSDLIVGTREHRDVPGLFGFSVQSWPGVTVEELARAGRLPHARISVTTRDTLWWLGFEVVLSTPGKGDYHATVRAPFPLPRDIATRLGMVFTRRRNPWPVP